jgi:FG-GAP-like repeat/FG-GAP repeat
MKAPSTGAIKSCIIKLAASTALLGSLCGSAVAQNYMYGQAGLQTGTNPSGLAIADFNGDGRPDLAVVNQGDNTVSVILTKPDGTFAPKVDYPVGNSPFQVVAADFNSDGVMDLAVVNSADNTVSLLLGVSGGTFKPQTTIPTGQTPVAIAAGDFDGDGKMDLAIANQTDSTISILLGNGQGSFTSQSPVSISGAPHFLVSGDVNNDGKADLIAVANVANSGDTVFLLISNGNGAFSLSNLSSGLLGSGNGDSITNVAIGDFNNDGNLDLAFSIAPALVNSNFNAYVLLGNGMGTFETEVTSLADLPITPFSPPAPAVAAGDFNHDGNLDLAVVDSLLVAVYLGNGSGTFASPMLGGIPTGGIASGPQQVVVAADFNNDALPDLAAVAPADSVVSILLGNGDGTLGSRYDITLPMSGTTPGAVIADLNNDGKLDLATAEFNQAFPSGIISGFVTSLLGNGDGTFQTPASSSSSDMGIGQLVSGNFIGNDDIGLASADVNADGGVALFLGNGAGSFGLPIESFTTSSANPLNIGPTAAGDFNGDGKTDLIVISEDSSSINSPLYILLSQGDGTLTASLIYNLAYGFVPGIAVADFNGDGFLDVAATTLNATLVFLGRGDGTFQAPITYSDPNAYPNSIGVGDFNGDGKIDMVVGHYSSAALYFYAGNGDGTFQAPIVSTVFAAPNTLVAGDFNSDGLTDVADGSLNLIYLGNGHGTFQGGAPFEATYGVDSAYSGARGDLNRDGTPDFVQVGHPTAGTLGSTVPQIATVWLSTPVLSFTASSLQFGTQQVGASSSPGTIQLSNVGNAPLSVTNIAVSGDFSQTNTCPSTLAVMKGCSVQITFTPTLNGLRSGSLTFSDNAKPRTQALSLTGWAGPPDFVPSISPTTFTVQAGSSAKYSLLLTSGDGFAGTVQVSCSGMPSEAACTVSAQSVPLSANGTATVQVTINTTAPSSTTSSPMFLKSTRPSNSSPLIFLSICFFLVFFWAEGMLLERRRVVRLLSSIALCCAWAACGGGGSGSGGTRIPPVTGTPPGNYAFTLTMTSGTSIHTLMPTLVVE